MEKLLISVDQEAASSIEVCTKETLEGDVIVTDVGDQNKFEIPKPKRKFRSEWMSRFPWLKNKRGKAYCTVCAKSIANMLSNIERHNKQKYHQRHFARRVNPPPIVINKYGSVDKKIENLEGVYDENCDQYSSNSDMTCLPSAPFKKITGDIRDSQQIFADYVADQMRNMSETKQRRLKLLIQKAIIEIEEGPEDMNTSITSSNTPHMTQVVSQSDQAQEKSIFVQLSSPEANMWREYFVFNGEKNGGCIVETNDTASENGDHESVTLQISDVDPLQAKSNVKTELSTEHDIESNVGHSSRINKQRSIKRDMTVVNCKAKRKFRPEWATRFPWLKDENGSAFCTLCSKSMSNMLSNIERHNKQQSHQLHMLQEELEK